MLSPIKPICKRNKIRRDGTILIFIQYCLNSEKRTLLNTGIAIPPSYWSHKSSRILKNLPKEYGDYDSLNAEIQQLIRLAEDLISYASKTNISNPLAFLKQTFKPGLDIAALNQRAEKPMPNKIKLDFYQQIDDYIETKRRQVCPKMINVYRNMKETLRAFENFRKKQITFDSFDYNFYEEFVNYMTHDHVQRRRKDVIKGFKVSTIGKTIKQLRIFLNNRMRKKIIPQINLEDFRIVDEEADAIYLTVKEIRIVYETDFEKLNRLVKYRDLFVLGCLTGLRFSDFSNIKLEDVRNGMLYKKQSKSDHWVVIPLRMEAKEILEKYNHQIPEVSNAEFNKYIKEVGRLCGLNATIKFYHKQGNKDIATVKQKYKWITSHTCRRSFCTNEFLAGTPVELIMKISGHKSLRDFYKYIRITPEEAGQKIKELWQKRGDFQVEKEFS